MNLESGSGSGFICGYCTALWQRFRNSPDWLQKESQFPKQRSVNTNNARLKRSRQNQENKILRSSLKTATSILSLEESTGHITL